MTEHTRAEIDALRPKSPVRGGSSNISAGLGSVTPSGSSQLPMPVNMPMQGHGGNSLHNGRGGFNNPQRMMMQPVMAMGNMAQNDMSMMGWPDMGMNVNMGGMNGMNMGGMPGMNSMGLGLGQQAGLGFSPGNPGFGGFDGGQMPQMQPGAMGMGWMGNGEGQFVDPAGGMWDPGMAEGMMGMNGMGMGGNMIPPGMNGMGMGMGMGQWGGEPFDGPY